MTGGGTGGHIYPLIAVAEKIREISRENNFEAEILFAGAAGKYKIMLEGYNIKVKRVAGSKIRRYWSVLNLLEPFKMIIGLGQALWHLYFAMPEAVFSKGGPGALMVVLAAVFYRIPIVIHESDSVPSLTSRISAQVARSIGVAFAATAERFAVRNVAVTGNPVREELLNNRDEPEFAKRYFGFNPQKPVIFILGGSQGSEALNDFIIANAAVLLKKYQILHQTGEDNFKEVRGELKFIAKDLNPEERGGYKIFSYLKKDLKEALSAADLVVARAGSSIFEIASFGKPAVLVPLPNAGGDHQRYNAYEFGKGGGGVIIEENNLTAGVFMSQVDKILNNPQVKARMQAAAKNFYIPGSAKMLAEEIIKAAIK